MGYKLAGFNVIGGVEIDPEMMRIYKKNHNPKYSYLMGVQDFNKLPDAEIPKTIFDIDVLDGSPPCSSFSMAGSREDAWGKDKKFREGQAKQILDDLFFDFIRTAEKLKPKIVVAENVKGLIAGAARGYVKQIFSQFDHIGYDVQLFLLNASRMGVPQMRERTFFIARRKDLKLPEIKFDFNEAAITLRKAVEGCETYSRKLLSPKIRNVWHKVSIGDSFSKSNDGSFFSWRKMDPDKPSMTITATPCYCAWNEPKLLSNEEVRRIQTFPDDYDFDTTSVHYMCGMSVPPLMMQRVALNIAELLLSNGHARDLDEDKGPKALKRSSRASSLSI